MSPKRFHIATYATGREHSITLLVFDEHEAMLDALERAEPRVPFRDGPARGAFIGAWGFWSEDAPRTVGTIYLYRGGLETQIVAHEAIHAACHVYAIDILRRGSRAMSHIVANNETMAYLAGNLIAAINDRLHAGGFYDRRIQP